MWDASKVTLSLLPIWTALYPAIYPGTKWGLVRSSGLPGLVTVLVSAASGRDSALLAGVLVVGSLSPPGSASWST